MLRLFMLIFAGAFTMAAQANTTITYQGQLEENGMPLDGTPGMAFRLFDSLTDGNQIGETQSFTGVPVETGLFQVELDFGPGTFDGSDRYLEVEVSANTLSPRQKITGTPIAQHALEVAAGSIGSDQIAPGAVGSTELVTDSLTISSGSGLQGGGEISLGGTATLSIADGGVGSAKIATGAVDSNHLATGAVTASAIAADSVGADQADSYQVQLRITGTCDPGTTLVGINVDGSVVCEVLPMGVAYQADSDGDAGRFSAIAIRQDGMPIISYLDDTNFNLKVYDCLNLACSAGVARTLDSEGVVGAYTAIAIRHDGRPIISYFDGTNFDIKVYDCNNPECSEGDAHTLESDSSAGFVSAIAIRDDGNPIISYHDEQTQDLKVHDCTNTSCTEGISRTLDSDGNVGDFNAIAIRHNGLPIISYRDLTNDYLKIYDCTSPDCSSGTARMLTSTGTVGGFSSVAIRDDGRPIISYRKGDFLADGTLNIYDCMNSECSDGTTHTLDSEGSAGNSNSIAIREDGLPIISYQGETDLRVFDCFDDVCSEGSARTLDFNGNFGNWFTGIAIRDNNLPIISYDDYNYKNLKIYSCGDPQCAQ